MLFNLSELRVKYSIDQMRPGELGQQIESNAWLH